MNATPQTEARVSLVMITWNRREEVCRTLEKLRALPGDHPIIVVDNGSTDDTHSDIRDKFPGIIVIRAPRNLGAAGRNLGVERVRTPYVAFCDDDVWWAAGALEAGAAILDVHPEIAVLNARIVVGPEERPDPACEDMARSPLEPVEGVGPRLSGFMAGACMMRTHVFLDAGGYWPPMFIGGEEELLSLDILDAGGSIVYAPALLVHHWPSDKRDSANRRRVTARNTLWTAWLRFPMRMAMHKTRSTLASLPDTRSRARLLFDALVGGARVARNRKVLGPACCAMVERVWRHDRRNHA